MRLCKRFKPCGQASGNLLIASLQCLDPRKLAVQRGRNIDRRPADDPQALIKAFW